MAENPEKSSKKVLDIMNEQVKTQAAFNDIIENSVSNLNEVLKKYTDINNTAGKGIKTNLGLLDISKNLVKAKLEQVKQQKQSDNIEKSISEKSKKYATDAFNAINKKAELEKNYYEAVKKGDRDKAVEALKSIKNNDTEIQRKTAALKIEEKIYLAQLQANKSSEDSLKTLSNKFTIIRGTFNSLKTGISGLAGGASKILGSVGGAISGKKDFFSTGIDLMKMIPGVGGAVAGLVGGFKSLLDFILEIDDKIIKFGRNLGFSKDQSYEVYKNFTRIQESSGKLLTTTANLMEVQTDLSQQLGVNNILTGEMLETQIELKKIMGLSTEEMGSLAQASIIAGKSQKDVVTGVLAQVEGLKQATGISFNYKQIIGEASKLGGVLGLQFAKYPEKLTKSLVVTKALGMDLAKVDQIAGSLLDFESSIQNQLEAQLITGKDINLSRAQQLALEGDTAGVAMEISKQFGTANEFLNMNRIQQESIAKAVGMTREDLANTLKNQEMLTKLGAKDTDNAQKRLQLALAKFGTEKEINKALGEGAYQNLTQLSAQEKIAELIEKVKSSIQGFLVNSGIVEYITSAIDYLTNPTNVKALISTLKEGVATIAEVIKEIAVFVLNVAGVFSDKAERLSEKLDKMDVGGMIRGNSAGGGNYVRGEMQAQDFVIKPLPQDTIASNGVTVQGGTRLGRTDEMVDLLKQILSETKQGKVMSFNIDGAPVAAAVARNASLTPAASNLGPRPLR